jgi:hypothetical protein
MLQSILRFMQYRWSYMSLGCWGDIRHHREITGYSLAPDIPWPIRAETSCKCGRVIRVRVGVQISALRVVNDTGIIITARILHLTAFFIIAVVTSDAYTSQLASRRLAAADMRLTAFSSLQDWMLSTLKPALLTWTTLTREQRSHLC